MIINYKLNYSCKTLSVLPLFLVISPQKYKKQFERQDIRREKTKKYVLRYSPLTHSSEYKQIVTVCNSECKYTVKLLYK